MKTSDVPVIEMRGIHKFFAGVHALKGVSFDLYPGEIHALVGENGAGKSTLIKIMSGVYDASDGEYFIDGKPADIKQPNDSIEKGIGVIYQELNSAKYLSVAENVFFGRLPSRHGRILWSRLYKDTEKYLRDVNLNVSPRMKVQFLSVAQQQLVEIAKALSLNAKVIVMDEPTSALSPKEIECLFEVIRNLASQGVAIVYVSHKLEEIFALADRITVFRDGAVIDTVAKTDVTPEQLIEMMVGRKMTDMFPPRTRVPGEIMLEVNGLSSDEVTNLSFNVRKGEIVGFSGLMGAGRTEMTRVLFGIDRRTEGTALLDKKPIPPNSPTEARKMGIGLVTENRRDEGLLPVLSVKKNLTVATLEQITGKLFHIQRGKELAEVTKMVDQLSIKTPSLDQLISKLSGGNQQKVLLGRWLLKENLKLLIVDEPTRGIDIGAKAEIYSILDELAKKGLSVLIISSELPEILGMCDRIYVMKEGRISGEFTAEEANEKVLLTSAI